MLGGNLPRVFLGSLGPQGAGGHATGMIFRPVGMGVARAVIFRPVGMGVALPVIFRPVGMGVVVA